MNSLSSLNFFYVNYIGIVAVDYDKILVAGNRRGNETTSRITVDFTCCLKARSENKIWFLRNFQEIDRLDIRR